MKDRLLVDADILLYRCGFSCEKKHYVVGDKFFDVRAEAQEYAASNGLPVEHKVVVEPVENALHNCNTVIRAIQARYEGAELRLLLTAKGNFRHEIATILPYKGNRSVFAKPAHYEAIREHLKGWGAIVVDGMEADDEIGIQAMEAEAEGLRPIIVSTDKDLNMIPVRHFNWVNKEEYSVGDEEAYRHFFGQCLTGDRVDNVPGIPKVGPERAGKILADARRPRAMLHAARKAWRDAYPEGVTCHTGKVISADQALIEHGRLLWIKREREEPLWHPNMVV